MRVHHHISVMASRQALRPLAKAGVPVDGEKTSDGEIYLIFDIDEDDPRWPAVAAWMAGVDAGDLVSTTFADEEIVAARWSALVPTWFHSWAYPTPGENGYRAVTFDLTERCGTCGIGARQKAPYRFRREPRWGRHAVMGLGLGAGHGEVFVKAEVWREVLAPHRVPARPVVLRDGRELATVVQLDAQEVVQLETQGLEPADGLARCPQCRRTKYDWVRRGRLPALLREPRGPIAWAEPYVGSGGKADRYLLVSQPVARAIVAAKLRGALLHPVAERAATRKPKPKPAGRGTRRR